MINKTKILLTIILMGLSPLLGGCTQAAGLAIWAMLGAPSFSPLPWIEYYGDTDLKNGKYASATEEYVDALNGAVEMESSSSATYIRVKGKLSKIIQQGYQQMLDEAISVETNGDIKAAVERDEKTTKTMEAAAKHIVIGFPTDSVSRNGYYESKGRYYLASMLYMKILEQGNGTISAEIKEKLVRAAPLSYQYMLKRVQAKENAGDYRGAFFRYREIQVFTQAVGRYIPVTFVAIDIDAKINELKTKIIKLENERNQKLADQMFAIADYKNAKNYTQNPRTAECYYRLGLNAQYTGNFKKAAEEYSYSNKLIPGYKDTAERISYCTRNASQAGAPGKPNQLHETIKNIEVRDTATSIIANNPSLLLEQDEDGRFPLHVAAGVGDTKTIKYMLKFPSPDINSVDYNGDTPLNIALQNQKDESAMLLIQNGAKVNIANNPVFMNTPLHLTAYYSPTTSVAELLLSNGAEIDACNANGNTPLMLAVYSNHIDAVKFFIDKGADINAKNNDGLTPLSVSQNMGYNDIAELLRSKRARE